MTIEAAGGMLPGGPGPGQDRYRTDHGLIVVLDGASAFDPTVNPDASDYVDTLADALLSAYSTRPSIGLADGLAWAIRTTADELALTPGSGPSSTVAIVRWTHEAVEVLALGDSPVIVQTRGRRDVVATDDLAEIAPELREKYRANLASGYGFSEGHRATLAELQRRQAASRNRDGGYWIAEAAPEAAAHAATRTYDAADVLWCVAATDGAQRPADHLGHDWPTIAKFDDGDIVELLVALHHWEAIEDPTGAQLPRSKRHDDKTIAVLRRV